MPNNVNSLENFRTEELPPEPQFPSWLNMLASNLGHAMLNLLSPTETSLADPPTQIDLKPIIRPYHTLPVSHPSQFHLEVDPKSANNPQACRQTLLPFGLDRSQPTSDYDRFIKSTALLGRRPPKVHCTPSFPKKYFDSTRPIQPVSNLQDTLHLPSYDYLLFDTKIIATTLSEEE
jgi:hypothetical protein